MRKAIFFFLLCLFIPVYIAAEETAAAAPPVEITPENAAIIRDVPFGNDGALLLDVVRPADRPAARMPAVVFVHGGGWSGGDKKTGIRWLLPFAQSGYYCVTINYRLSGEARFPAQIHDCKTAVRWLRAHADEYGVDPDRIGAWGMSAGGHLAALLGVSGGVESLEGNGGWPAYSSRVQAVCDYYGPTDLPRFPAHSDKQYGTPDSPEVLLLGGTMDEKPELARLASPVTHISAADPPFLIMQGTADETVPAAQSGEFHAALKKAGVESELRLYPGAGHSLDNRNTIPVVMAFFDRCLRR
jgi:acetyl esterase/lipase